VWYMWPKKYSCLCLAVFLFLSLLFPLTSAHSQNDDSSLEFIHSTKPELLCRMINDGGSQTIELVHKNGEKLAGKKMWTAAKVRKVTKRLKKKIKKFKLLSSDEASKKVARLKIKRKAIKRIRKWIRACLEGGAPAIPKVKFADIEPIIERECMSCHADREWTNSEEYFINSGRVVPGDLERSTLYTFLQRNPEGFLPAYMPKDKAPLPDDEVMLVRQWILDLRSGAGPDGQPTPTPGGPPLIGNAQNGEQLYQSTCNGCHTDNPQQNFNNILNGATEEGIRNAIMTVPNMAGFRDLLDNPQMIADLAAFLAEQKIAAENKPPTRGLLPEPALCVDTPLQPNDTIVRRLTVAEYSFSIEDLFTVDISDQLNLLPLELRPAGFTNDALGLIITFEHIQGYFQLAQIIVDRVQNWNAFVQQHTSCTTSQDNCRTEYIQTLGGKLFRNEVTNEELATLLKLFQDFEIAGKTFFEAAQLVTRAMLQSPRFLYRLELRSTGGRLSGYEIASRLSFLAWASTPDQALLDAAQSNQLRTEAQLLAQLDRLLSDPKAERAAVRLFREWFLLDTILAEQRPNHSDFTPAIASDMRQESINLFEQLRLNDQPLISAYTLQKTYVTDELATFYGLRRQLRDLGNGVKEYDLAGTKRVGLLTHGSIVAPAGGERTSIVQRGLGILNRVMCSFVAQPPAGVDTTPPVVSGDASQRIHSLSRVNNATCGVCHRQFEPLGWGFEQFDPVGRTRTRDQAGNLLSPVGWFQEPITGAKIPYTNTIEYADGIANSQVVQDCLVIKPTQYAFGRRFDLMDENDVCTLTDIRSRAEGAVSTYRQLLRSIVMSPVFAMGSN